jgi:hypothetical protein
MAHSDDATKAWVSAIPTKNADGNVIEWRCKYKYTLVVGTNKGNIKENDGTMNNDYIHIFDKTVKVETPSKAPASYTKAELLTLMDKDHCDLMFTRKYTVHTTAQPTITTDTDFDVSGLN